MKQEILIKRLKKVEFILNEVIENCVKSDYMNIKLSLASEMLNIIIEMLEDNEE